MTTKLNVQELSPLQRHVYRWAKAQAREYDDHNLIDPLKEVCEHGCTSGIVDHLIYTVDCVRFYRSFHREIDTLLRDMCADTGEQPNALFSRSGWDADDPLARDDQNQNILAWFGFEETANTLLRELDPDY